MSSSDVTPEAIQAAAPRVLGLPLDEAEAARVAAGAARNQDMARVVRGYVSRETEPASVFSVSRSER